MQLRPGQLLTGLSREDVVEICRPHLGTGGRTAFSATSAEAAGLRRLSGAVIRITGDRRVGVMEQVSSDVQVYSTVPHNR
jgi:hypothetical protein